MAARFVVHWHNDRASLELRCECAVVCGGDIRHIAQSDEDAVDIGVQSAAPAAMEVPSPSSKQAIMNAPELERGGQVFDFGGIAPCDDEAIPERNSSAALSA